MQQYPLAVRSQLSHDMQQHHSFGIPPRKKGTVHRISSGCKQNNLRYSVSKLSFKDETNALCGHKKLQY